TDALVLPEDRARMIESRQRRLAGEAVPDHYTVRARRKDGTLIWLELYLTLFEYQGKTAIEVVSIDVTEQMRAEGALRQREQEFRALAENSPDAIVRYAPDLRRTYANPAAIRMSGQTYDDFMATEISSIDHVDIPTLKAFVDALNYVLITRKPLTRNFDAVVAGGRAYHYETLFVPEFADDDDETVMSVLAIAHDITELVEAIQALRERETAYRTLADNLPDMIVRYNADLKRTYVNPITLEITGFTEAEFLNTDRPEQHFTPGDIRGYRQTLRRAIDTGTQQTFEITHTADDGTAIVLDAKIVPEFASNGTVQSVVVIGRDITERKRAEAALQYSENLHRILVDNFPDGAVALYDQALRCTLVGGRELERLGAFPHDLDSWELRQIFPPQIYAASAPLLEGALRGETGQAEAAFGDLTYLVQTLPIRNGTRQVVAGLMVMQNITARKQLTQQQLQSRLDEERLRLSVQTERDLSDLKTRMMLRLSHEFRTPLATIGLAAEMIERYNERMSAEQRHERYQQIHSQIAALTRMLDDMNFLVRFQGGQLSLDATVIDLGALCRQVIRQVRAATAATQTIRCVIAEVTGTVEADPHLLTQLITHLLTNAITYSAALGVIDVLLETTAECFTLTIRDEGIGIPPEDQLHIFTPFYRGSNIREVAGVGMGLSVVRTIVDIYRGTIHLDSTIDHGTTIAVWLPLPVAAPV
ncbi:MAG: PAS domain S-box protein, partial [Chloroflexi bacterium]|nr:PAS domain S-box protein [Chloroflexota bacterium]